MSITENTGVWCAASKVFFNKIIDHKITKLFTDVKDEVSKAVLHGRHPCVIEAIQV